MGSVVAAVVIGSVVGLYAAFSIYSTFIILAARLGEMIPK